VFVQYDKGKCEPGHAWKPRLRLCRFVRCLSNANIVHLEFVDQSSVVHPDSSNRPILFTDCALAACLVVRSLAVVPNDLEAAKHLADGEEAEDLRSDDAGGGQLRGAQVAGVLDERLRGGDGAGLDAAEDGLVVGLEGGDGTEMLVSFGSRVSRGR
jgi:hypothetical protein